MLTLIRHFSGTRPDNFSIFVRILPFSDTRSGYIIFRDSHLFDSFRVLAWTVFPYSHGLTLFPIVALIISFFGAHTYSTLFGYSPRQIFDTHRDSAIFRYSPGFYHFLVLTLIRRFSGTRPESFSILAPILPFSDTRSVYIIFRYSHLFDSFVVLARTVFRFSHESCLFPILARIISFFVTELGT